MADGRLDYCIKRRDKFSKQLQELVKERDEETDPRTKQLYQKDIDEAETRLEEAEEEIAALSLTLAQMPPAQSQPQGVLPPLELTQSKFQGLGPKHVVFGTHQYSLLKDIAQRIAARHDNSSLCAFKCLDSPPSPPLQQQYETHKALICSEEAAIYQAAYSNFELRIFPRISSPASIPLDIFNSMKTSQKQTSQKQKGSMAESPCARHQQSSLFAVRHELSTLHRFFYFKRSSIMFLPVQVSLQLAMEHQKFFRDLTTDDKSCSIVDATGGTFTFEFSRHNGVSWLPSAKEKENVFCDIYKSSRPLALWSYRTLADILQGAADAPDPPPPFTRFCSERNEILENKYTYRDTGSIFYFDFDPIPGHTETWIVDMNAMVARKECSHALMFPHVELMREEVIWFYESSSVLTGQPCWVNTSFEEALMLEQKFFAAGPQSSGPEFMDVTWNSLLMTPQCSVEVLRDKGYINVTSDTPLNNFSIKVFRKCWPGSVRGDAMLQCSQWFSTLKSHFNDPDNKLSYCHQDPPPLQNLENVWKSLLFIHTARCLHGDDCDGSCNTEKNFENFSKIFGSKLSPLLYVVLSKGMREVHSQLCSNVHPDIFKQKTWECCVCFKKDKAGSGYYPPMKEKRLNSWDVVTPKHSPLDECSHGPICQWAFEVSKLHRDPDKFRRPQHMAWSICQLPSVPYPDGYHQISKLFITTSGIEMDDKTGDFCAANSLNIFIQCSHFENPSHHWKIDSNESHYVKGSRNDKFHVGIKHFTTDMDCSEFKRHIVKIQNFVDHLATKVFALHFDLLKGFLETQKIAAQNALHALQDPITLLCLKFQTLSSMSSLNHDIRSHVQEVLWLDPDAVMDPTSRVFGQSEESLASFRRVRRLLKATLPVIKKLENDQLLLQSSMSPKPTISQQPKLSSAVSEFLVELKPIIRLIVELTLISSWEKSLSP
jgi:hypothetical protein